MDQNSAIELVKKFKDALVRSNVAVDRIMLFGSYATGCFNENSDIDVIVISESFTGLNHWQRIEKMTDALYELFQPIEARALTPEEWRSGKSMTAAYAESSNLIGV